MEINPDHDFHFRHNPAFLDKNTLISSFVGFERELQWILETLVQKKTNQLMIVAPRGAGKTSLVLRVVEEIHRSGSYQELLYPVVFPEESHDISSIGEFWLKVLFHLGTGSGNDSLIRSCLDLKAERNELMLLQKTLALLDTVKLELNRSILMVVENLSQILGQQLSSPDAMQFNAILSHTPGIKILGTSSFSVEQIQQRYHALFDAYQMIELKPLDIKSCKLLSKSVSVHDTPISHIRALHLLTQGNPRFFKDLLKLCALSPFAELQENLIQFIDQYTLYFKSQMDSLPPLERKVLFILAEFWDPSTAREIAGYARIDINKASACLQRLLSKGILTVAFQEGRKQWYQIREPMYNIYLLVRSSQGNIPLRLKAILQFMVNFYCANTHETQGDFQDKIITYFPLKTITIHDFGFTATTGKSMDKEDPLSSEQLLILEEIEQEILKEPDNPNAWTKLGTLLMNTPYRERDAENVFKKAIALDPNAFTSRFGLGVLFAKNPQRYSESKKAFTQALKRNPEDARSWFNLAVLLSSDPEGFHEAEKAYKKATELDPDDHWAWNNMANLLSLNADRFNDSHAAYLKALELNSNDDRIWTNLGLLLSGKQNHGKQAEGAYKRALELNSTAAGAWIGLGILLQSRPDQLSNAINSFKNALKLDQTNHALWIQLIRCHLKAGDPIAAVKTGQELVDRFKPSPDSLNELAVCFSCKENLAALEQAETWIRDVRKKESEVPDYAFTLSVILGKQGKWDESIDISKQFICDSQFVEKKIGLITDYYIEAAAEGFAERALDCLDSEKKIFLLEPVVTGLKLFTGESCRSAREIMEIGRDIVEKIEQNRGAVNG